MKTRSSFKSAAVTSEQDRNSWVAIVVRQVPKQLYL